MLILLAPESCLHLPNKLLSGLTVQTCQNLFEPLLIPSVVFLFFFLLFFPPLLGRLPPLAVIGQWDKIIPNSFAYRI